MKKMWKRFVSLLLACTLLAGMLPLSASAAVSAPGKDSDQYKYAKGILDELNGSLEPSEQYTLNGPYQLEDSEVYIYELFRSILDDSGHRVTDTRYVIVPGKGATQPDMPDYENGQDGQPWAESNPSAVYIADGVTGIGNHAFDGMSTLETLEIQNPGSLTRIGEHAFNGCDKLVGPLNLSGVTEMGEYAFNGCERLGSGEDNEGVKLSDALTTIPENAFNTCGLKNVNIPTSCTEIGNNAFANNSLSEITELALPERLQKIGDNAFSLTMGEGDTSSGITSLTIPSTVTSIGVDAFSGRRNLQTVTVEDDGEEKTELTLGDGAFGRNEFTAYSEQGSITDAAGTTYHGLLGTTFYLPADLVTTFRNGENCFTGDISPMEYVDTVEPTCTIYKTTISGAISGEGQPVVVTYHVPLQMLGHDYQFSKNIPATCETDSYDLYVCTHDNRHTENRNVGNESGPKGHNYLLTDVENLGMGDGSATTFTWTCQKQGHDDSRDRRKKEVKISINPTAVQADTTMTYGELVMPTVEGGKLTLAEDVGENAPLTTDVTSVKVVFTPDLVTYAGYTGMGAVSGFEETPLTLQVNVSKAKLDFSSVRFNGCVVDVNPETGGISPIEVVKAGLPEDVTYDDPIYTSDLGGEGQTTPPDTTTTWNGHVSVTFHFEPSKYEVDQKQLPQEYDVDYSQVTDGKVTITHAYQIVQMTMDNLKAEAIEGLTYTAAEQPAIRLSGVPNNSAISWTWKKSDGSGKMGQGSADNGTLNNLDTVALLEAGTYEVTITVAKEGYETKTLDPITVTIAKATVTTPTATAGLEYTGTVQTGLETPSGDDLYTYTEDSQLTETNAGPYTAKAQLNDSENYRWSTGDSDGDGTVEISWNIAKRRVIETSINSVYKDQTTPFTGTPITAVSPPSSTSSGFFDVTYDDKGNLVGKIKGTETVAFKISHAQETNAETYTVIASIEDFANFCWQNHPKDKDVSLGTWTIGKLQINAPTITAEGATYTGGAYAGKVTLVHSDSSEGIIDLEKTKISYYADKTGGEPMAPPVNVGTYYAGVEEWTFVKGELAQNYNVLGGQRGEFKITQKQATMEFTNKAVTATYTAQGTTLQQVKVSGLVDADKDEMKTVLGDVKYTYKYSTEPNPNWESMEAQQITEPAGYTFTTVGYYQITATWGTGTVSNNYTAAPAIYTLTIEKAANQSITLTPDKQGTWTEAINQTPAKYTITYGEAATFKVTGKAALDDASISYAVNGGSNVVSVDGRSGVVTIHKAGTATITVTAAETPNVGAASVEYTVTVKKAKPTVNTNLPDNKLEVAYTGNPITDTEYNKATATANVVDGAEQPTGDITYTFYTDESCETKVVGAGGTDGNIPIAVGTYYMKATYPGDKNYTSAESQPVTVTVTKAQLTVDAEGHTGTYDGKTYPAITIKSVKGNGTTLAQGQYTVKYAKTNTNIAPGADADVWQNLLTVKDVADSTSENLYYWYMVTADNYNPAIGEVEVKIAPAPLTVAGEPTHYTKEYDGDKTVDETFDEITVTAKDVPEVTIDVDATGTYDNENAGEGKNVTLTLTLSGTDGTEIDWDNYSYNGAAPTDGKITLTKDDAGTINPKEITVTGISAVDRVYDGTKVVQLTGKPKTEDTLFNEDGTVFLALAEGAKGQLQDATAGNGKAVSVGNDAVKITGEGSGNYSVTVSLPNLTVDIKKATPTVTITGASNNKLTVAYTGNPVSVVATVAGISNTDKPTGEVTFRSYESVEAAQNDTTGTDGTELKEMPSNGGPYYLRAFIAEETNYKAAVSDYVELVIDATALSVTTGGPAEKSYTGTEHNMAQWADMKVQFSGKDVQYDVVFLKKGEDETSAPDAEGEKWNSGVSAITNVAESGEYWYKVTAKEGEGNFNPHVSTSAITFTVTPATLTLSSSLTKEKGYDGTTVAAVTGQKVTGAQNGENITVSSVSAAYDNANVGTGKTITTTYTVTFDDGVTPGNYAIGNNGAQITQNDDGTWTVTTEDTGSISAKSITVTIADKNKIYDGQAPSVTSDKDTDWTVDEGALCSQDGTVDELRVVLSVESDGNSAVGTYAITGKAENKNYAVTFTGSWTGGTAGTYTIDPRPINVQIGNAEGFYGDAPVLTGVELTYEGTDEENYRGLAPDENSVPNITLGTGASAQSPVAGYVIYAVDGNNGQIQNGTSTVIGNYNVTFTNEGTYTVNPRPITITIKDHRSKYGAAIDDGIATPVFDTDYTVAITAGNTVTGGAIVNGDDLGITLFTTAKKGDNAGTYSISGTVTNKDLAKNYAITWKGENPFTGEGEPDSTKATYTVEKAELTVEAKQTAVYAQYGQETANPLTFTNASTGEEITVADSNYETLENAVTYTLNPPGSLTMETENKAEGKFTVNVTDTTVTVEVNVAETDNFKAATMIAYDVYTSASGSLTVDLPFADLTYTSEEQKLLTGAPTLPADVVIRYKLGGKGTWTKYSDEAPNNWQSLVGTGAGDYTVYWETKAGGNYNASSGHETTEIKKADLSATYKGLNDSEVTLVLSEMRDTYTIPLDLTGNKGYTHSNGDGVTFLSGNTDVAIAKNSTATLELRGVAGEAKITINCPGDNNYNPGTFTFTVTVTDQKAEILYDVTGTTRDYNGQPQTIAVNVTQPDSGATVMYQDKDGNYTLSEPPAYTDVKEGGYPIKFQITAPGYKTEEGTATLKIEPKPITENMIAGIAESYTYVGHQIRPETVAVVDDSVILTKDTDYTLEYGANEEVGEDKGSVIIKGTGNYTGEVTVYFNIAPVDGSSGMTASIDPAYGTYDPDGNTATVTVTHQTGTDSHEVTLTAENASYTITATDLVTGDPITERGATGTGNTLTFTKPAIYDITLTLTGDHRGEFHLSYTLLPLSNEDGGLTLTVDDETQKVFTYGDEIDSSGAAITVTADGNIVTDQCTLTYEYTGFDQTTVSGDYSPSVLKNAGVYTVTATPTEGSTITGTGTFTFLILQRDLADAILDVDDADLVFNHDEKRPSVTVTVDGNAQPTKDADYTITYYNSVNASDAAKAVVTATGNNFTGSKTAEFTIAPKPITDCVVENIPDQHYTGKEVVPPVTIKDSGYTLILGYDYTTACEDKGPGAATVTIKGTGNYTETTTKDFVIKSEGAPEPSERFDLVVTPSQWTWGDDLTNLDLSVTFGTDKELQFGTDYTIKVDEKNFDGVSDSQEMEDVLSYIKGLKPDEYTITATGVGAYNGSTDTETVTIQKIQPTVTVTATPNSLSGGGKVTLTLKGEKLPAFAKGEDLSDLLTVTVQNGQQAPDLKELEWTENPDGSLTAELTLPNTNETYTFALRFAENDYYESASSDAMVVVGQQTSGGGGGSDPGDQPADPDDTGVSDWLNTKDHLAYLAGYPGGIFGPDQNMTRAEAAQMFYNLLLEKDVELTVEFEDVPADAWYAKPVNTLASLGILSGVGNGRFDPERSITRAEFTVIAMKFANTSGGGVNIFSDVNEDDWFYSAVVDSTQYGWINGYPDGTFRPEATISRAEVTVIVNHMLGRAADRPYVIAHEKELNTFGDVNRGHWGYFHIAEATNAHEYHTEDGTESWTGLS